MGTGHHAGTGNRVMGTLNHPDLTTKPESSDLLEAALAYAARGWSVFPVHSTVNGKCTCGNLACDRPGKHPRTKHGLKEATTDPERITRWWATWPNANIGVCTGSISGFVVLDVDGQEGQASLDAFQEKHGQLPDTVEVQTGKGFHLYFSHPGLHISNSSGKVGKGLDVRGDDGYIIAPPSHHQSGKQYQWVLASHPDDLDIAAMPAWLLSMVQPDNNGGPPNKTGKRKAALSLVLNGVPKGERDEKIFRYACRLRAQGLTRPEITSLVLEAARNCDPPFEEDQALRKIQSAFDIDARRNPNDTTADDLSAARKKCQGIMEAVPKEPQIAVRPENIAAFTLVSERDPETWVSVKTALRKHRVLSDVEKQIRKARLSVVSPDDNRPLQILSEILRPLEIEPPEGCSDLVLPARYVFDEQGTGRTAITEGGGRQRYEVAPAPLIIAEKFVDMSGGEESLKLAFFRADRWHTLVVPRGAALATRRCVDLADLGYPVGSHTAAEVARFNFDFETANQDRLIVHKTCSQMGWIRYDDNLSFMCGRELLTSASQRDTISFKGADIGDEQYADGFRRKGTSKKWFQAISSLGQYPHVRLALYAVLGSPLLWVLGARNFGVDYAAPTSTGKTELIRLAASAWGNPTETDANTCLHTWDQTRVSVERISAVACDLPLLLDDTKKARSDDISPALYSVISGHGRGRGSVKGLRRTYNWRTVLVSTGEGPLVSYAKDAGLRARVITARGLPFEKQDEETRRLVDTFSAQVRLNYGHAGPMFVRWLLSIQDRWDDFRDRFSELKTKYAGKSGAASRIGDMAALIDLAGELAHEALPMPWSFKSPFEDLWDSVCADIEDVHIHVRGLRDIISWAWQHQETFFGRHDERPPLRGWSGRWDREDTWESIAFYPTVLRSALEQLGYKDVAAVISGWREEGWLNAPEKNTYTKVERVAGESKRLVVIKREAIEKVEGLAVESPSQECELGEI